MVKPRASLKAIFTVRTLSRPFGFLTSTVAYGSAVLAQCTSTAVPSFRGRAVPPVEDAVGVERWVGRERYVAPPLSPVLVPEPYVSPPDEELSYEELPDEELSYEPPPPDVDDELSWSWRELLQPPPPPLW